MFLFPSNLARAVAPACRGPYIGPGVMLALGTSVMCGVNTVSLEGVNEVEKGPINW